MQRNCDIGFCITITLVMSQAQIQSGEREGELRFKLAWSKVKKRYDADPVLEAKDYSFLQEMLCGAIEQTESASKVASHKEGEQHPSVTSKPSDTRHVHHGTSPKAPQTRCNQRENSPF